jgi:tRNA U34 5-carboxymethylaminomethyl modifying GTPase MnmE/TrmE
MKIPGPVPPTCNPIFVRTTLPGSSGIATLLLDGESVISLLEPKLQCERSLRSALLPPLKREGSEDRAVLPPLPREGLGGSGGSNLFFGRLFDSSERVVDEVVVALLNAKESPTGNTQIELSCHGGEGATAAVEEVLLQAGFLRGSQADLLARAHLNGKLSLLACEEQLALARALTARQAELLLGRTAFQKRWERFGFELAMGLRTKEDSWQRRLLEAAREELARAPAALALLARHHVVLTGPVNSGKSSLANRLARSERHLVSPLPGATRDRLDTPIALRGLNLLLTDTAGVSGEMVFGDMTRLRSNRDRVPENRVPGNRTSDLSLLSEKERELESEGVRRGEQAAATATLRLLVLDGSREPGEAEIALAKQAAQFGPFLLVLNKRDLGLHEAASGLGWLASCEPLAVSARTGEGLAELEEALEARLLAIPQCCARTPAPPPLPSISGDTPSTRSVEPIPIAAQSGHVPGNAFTRRQVALLEQLRDELEKGAGAEALSLLRKLVGRRPDAEQLALMLEEK